MTAEQRLLTWRRLGSWPVDNPVLSLFLNRAETSFIYVILEFLCYTHICRGLVDMNFVFRAFSDKQTGTRAHFN